MELEKPWTTELQVRMDCNGCVQKMKRLLHGIEGVCEVAVDLPQQRVKVVGTADPEKMVKTIRKTRKVATVCSHTENAPAAADHPPPPADVTDPPPPKEEPAPEPAPPPAEQSADPQPPAPVSEEPLQPREVEEVPMVHHYPHQYWNPHSEAPPYRRHSTSTAIHSYSNYPPPPSATVVAYPPLLHHHQPQQSYVRGGGGSSDGSTITSMFSDENPNACAIV